MSRFMRMLGLVAAAVGIACVAMTLRSARPGPSPGPHPARGETAGTSRSRGAPRTNQGTRVYALARLEPAGGLIVVGAAAGGSDRARARLGRRPGQARPAAGDP